MKRRKLRISLVACGILLLGAYLALPYVLWNVTIRHDPSYRRVVTAISQGISAETNAAMRDRMASADEGDFETLLELLVEVDDPWKRECVLMLLLNAPDPGRIPTETLHARLRDPAENVAFWSARLLGRIGSRESTPHLLEALSDERPRVVYHAATALLEMYTDDPELESMKAKVQELTKGVLEFEEDAEADGETENPGER